MVEVQDGVLKHSAAHRSANSPTANLTFRARLRKMFSCRPLGIWNGVDVGAHHAHLVIFLVQVVQQNVTQ